MTTSSPSSGLTAFVVGLAVEERIVRRAGWPAAIGGGTSIGARRAAQRLIEAGASELISFGLAGGLDPALAAGTLVVARAVVVDGRIQTTDPAMNARLGGHTGHLCLGLNHIAATVREKQHLRRQTGAALVDMESGEVASVALARGVPFAVVRAICDPADRPLPPAALTSLHPNGRLAPLLLARSILRQPGQLRALTELAGFTRAAKDALRAWVEARRSHS